MDKTRPLCFAAGYLWARHSHKLTEFRNNFTK